MEADVPYQIQAAVTFEQKDEFIKELDKMSDIDSYYCVNNAWLELGEKGRTHGFDAQTFENEDFLTDTYKKLFNSSTNLFINYVDDDDFNQLCEDNGIDYKAYYGDTAKALLMNNISHRSDGNAVFNDKVINTEIKDPNDNKILISGFVKYDEKNYVCNLNPKSTISLYIPVSVERNVINKDADGSLYLVGIETDQHEKVTNQIEDLFDNSDYGSTYISDYVETLQMMNTLSFILEVFVYGFIALISLITVANIINTISTNIAMRRKEFAMFKSVGITPKGFRKMVSLESVFYGIKALIFSLPLSLLISYGMNNVLSDTSIPFEINWLLYLAVVAVVFLIIGFTMLYAVSKLKNDSIVGTLKEEIN